GTRGGDRGGGPLVVGARRRRHRAPDGSRPRRPHRGAEGLDPAGDVGRTRGACEHALAGGGTGDDRRIASQPVACTTLHPIGSLSTRSGVHLGVHNPRTVEHSSYSSEKEKGNESTKR